MTAIDTTTLISNLNGVQSNSSSQTKENDGIGKEEFLTMLVAQLQNQDPLDPMSNDDFAVNLAQFSQLEQLISINKNIEASNKSGVDTFSSMASYLGHEVVLDSNYTRVTDGDAGSISFDLSSDAESVQIELLNASGTTMGTVNLDGMSKGHCCVDLDHVAVANGEYQIKVTAVSKAGVESNPVAYSAGIVDGYIPGETPVLLVNGNEITLDNIREVRVANFNA